MGFSGDRSLLQSAGRSRPAHGDRVGSGCLYAKMSPRGQGTMTESCLQKVTWLTSQDVSTRGLLGLCEATSQVSTVLYACRVRSPVRAPRGGRARSSVFFYHEILNQWKLFSGRYILNKAVAG